MSASQLIPPGARMIPQPRGLCQKAIGWDYNEPTPMKPRRYEIREANLLGPSCERKTVELHQDSRLVAAPEDAIVPLARRVRICRDVRLRRKW